MKRILRKGAAALIAVSLFATLAVAVQHRITTPDPLGFDPTEMGRLESAMWQSYYEGRWMRLGVRTLAVSTGQFGYSWWDGARMSFYAAKSAAHFRKDTRDARCLPLLIRYYEIIRRRMNGSFGPEEAAALELRWWQQRRGHETNEEIQSSLPL